MDPELVKALTAQLSVLNDRSRWYTARLWQIPFAYLGIAVYAIIRMPNDSLSLSLFMSGLIGAFVLYHMYWIRDGISRAVEELRAVEARLQLNQTAEYRPEYSISFFLIVIAFSAICLILSFLSFVKPA